MLFYRFQGAMSLAMITDAAAMSAADLAFPITAVENLEKWTPSGCFCIRRQYVEPWDATSKKITGGIYLNTFPDALAFLRKLYDMKIGEAGNYWDDGTPIEYRYASILLADVFDYYTTADGVLKVPNWSFFKFAVDEYLEQSARVKFQPARVQQFIEVNGVDRLDEMQ